MLKVSLVGAGTVLRLETECVVNGQTNTTRAAKEYAPPPLPPTECLLFDGSDCCPDEELCAAGTEAACPYTACRAEMLEALLVYVT